MAGTSIAKYNAGCTALAKAKNVDEVKKVLVIADGLLAAARRASDRTAQIQYAEFRIRAMRRLGEIMNVQKRTVGLAKGGRPAKTGSKSDPVFKPATLAQAGIDKHLADEARKWAAMPEGGFEAFIAGWRKDIEVANKRITVTLTRPAVKWKQPPLFDLSPFHLSGSGRKLERVHQKNAYAPDWLKLSQISDRTIQVIAEGIRKLEKLAARIGKPDGVTKFQKEFNGIEARVTDLVDQYWRMRNLIASLESAGIAVQSEPEPEYDLELERAPDGNKGNPVPF